MRKAHYIFGIGTAIFIHLAAIPILSIYGVHICPVLNNLGFLFGCKFNGIFSISVLSINALLTSVAWLVFLKQYKKNPVRTGFIRYFPFFILISHFTSFVVANYFLNAYLESLQVPQPTLDKMNIAFFYTAILLGVLQSSIIDWMVQGWLRNHASTKDINFSTTKEAILGLTTRWTFSHFWNALPTMAVIVVSCTYIYAKYTTLSEDFEIDAETSLMLKAETYKIFALVVAWYMLIKTFTFLKEKRLIDSVHKHLDALSNLNPHYYSPTIASGFWESIFKALNQTTTIIEQRTRLMQGLTSYATSSVVDRVLSNKKLEIHGELKEITLLVSDLRNFTQMSNSLAAEDVVKILNIYFADMLEVLTLNGVTVDKFIGDGILAYIDEPDLSIEAAHQKAVTAALGMHLKINETNKKFKELGLPDLQVGVAVHSGKVILGSIGAKEKMQHTVIGDAVNATARLESLCKEYDSGIVISGAVFNSITQDVKSKFTDLGLQEIRGLKKPLHIYGVLNKILNKLAA
ncbi:MAG: adenylate/guanylate cyclase domain-containing protein [Oligoflexia bacterium]|nr:adenylate/guanylate cyclase domain-containing protein [Oligoflexia bacterium]